MIYNLLEPEEEEDPEESPGERQKESEKLANWQANFPYQPTTDPDVVITEEMLKPTNMADPPMMNHRFLRGFFDHEARFTLQFERLYHILEEHGRGDNSMATGKIYSALWHYHQYLQKDPEGLSRTHSRRTGIYRMNAEVAEIQGMDKTPHPRFVTDLNYEKELEVGDSLLAISPGWQKAYDDWYRRIRNI